MMSSMREDHLARRRFCRLEDDEKGAALAGGTSDADAAAMRHGDFEGDGQAEAGGGFALAGDAREAVENPGVVFFADAGAAVGDAELNVLISGGRGAQLDLAARGGLFDGVVDEVGKNMADALAVHVDGGQIRL